MMTDSVDMPKKNSSRPRPPLNSLELVTALRSCLLCRKRRRKCDRTPSGCLECRGLNRTCEYTARLKKRARTGIRSQQKDGPHTICIRSSPGKRAAMFIPPLSTGPSFLISPENTSIRVSIPKDVLQLLAGDIDNIQTTYFRSLHRWMPIISLKHLRMLLANITLEPRADLALLLLSMKLITNQPESDSVDWARSTLYYTAKILHRSIRISKRYSTHFLQAGLLISLYELGHAIYPEAQVSAAANAELGMELGINETASQVMNPTPSSWTESEERSRTWWGMMIVDRYVSLRIRGRQLTTPDPKGNHYVPVDDEIWEDGFEDTPVLRKTLVAEKPSTPGAGVFEREAHASYLLGQVVNLKLKETDSHSSHIDSEQLSNTLQSLSSLLKHDIDSASGPYYCAAVGMCNSALLTLHTPSFIPNSNSRLSPAEKLRELAICKLAADRVYELGILFFKNIKWPGLIDSIAPLVPDSIYQAGALYAFLARETGYQSYIDAYELMRRALKFFNQRWKVAGWYLNLLDVEFGNNATAMLSEHCDLPNYGSETHLEPSFT